MTLPARITAVIFGLFALAMISMIVVSSLEASLIDGLRRVVSHGWGITTLVDLEAGLLLIAIWIGLLERSVARAAPWIIGLLFLGNLTTMVYAIVRLIRFGSLRGAILGSSGLQNDRAAKVAD